jgi:hypothetical protein
VPIWQSPSIDKYAMRLGTLMNQIRRRSCHGMCRVVFYIKMQRDKSCRKGRLMNQIRRLINHACKRIESSPARESTRAHRHSQRRTRVAASLSGPVHGRAATPGAFKFLPRLRMRRPTPPFSLPPPSGRRLVPLQIRTRRRSRGRGNQR